MKFLFLLLPIAALVVGSVLSMFSMSPIEHMLITMWFMLIGLVIYSRTVGEDTMLSHIIKLRCSCGFGMLVAKISALVLYLILITWFFGCILPYIIKQHLGV